MSGQQGGPIDPILDLIHQQPLPQLAGVVRSQIQHVLGSWAQSVQWVVRGDEPASSEVLWQDLPEVLGCLADALESFRPEVVARLTAASARHGAGRFDRGENLERLMIEHRLLRLAIIRQLEVSLTRPITSAESLSLLALMDAVLQQSVCALTEQHDSRLRTTAESEQKHLAFLSHDLLNNLSSVTLWLKILRYRLTGVPQFVNDMEVLDQAHRSIIATVTGMERMLQAERLQNESTVVHVERIDLSLLTREVVGQLDRQAHEKGLSLKYDAPARALLDTDPALVRLILQNLIGNAIKYTSDGEVFVRCEYRERGEAGQWAVVSVIDHGPGINPAELGEIFKTFKRGTTHGQAGLGLGLAIVARAANLLGAELKVESEVGAGSRFEVFLPASLQ